MQIGIGVGTSRVCGSPEPGLLSRLQNNPVILWNGQSNAVGLLSTSANAGWMAQHIDTDLLGWSEAAGDWAQLEERGAAVSTSGGITGGGQVATLVMRRLIEGGAAASLRLLAGAHTSQGIAYFKDDSSTLAYYLDNTQHATLNNYDLVKSYADASDETALGVGLIVFIQGEADAGMSQATYFGHLNTLIQSWARDYPNAGVLLVLTNELTAANTEFVGVNAAKEQAAALYPHVHTLDLTAFTDRTSLQYLTEYHYTDALGYEELAEAIARVVLTGANDRATPADVDDLIDNGQTWVHRWKYKNQSTVTEVGTWVDEIAGKHLTGGDSPLLVRNDANLGNRSAKNFEVADTEWQQVALTGTDSTTWTAVIIGWLTSTAGTQTAFELNDGTPRTAFNIASTFGGGRPQVFINGSSTTFTSAPALDTDPHVWVLAVDTTEARLYMDGALVDTQAVSPSAMTGPTLYFGALVGVTQWLDANIAEFALATDAADLADAQAIQAYAVAEYGDIF